MDPRKLDHNDVSLFEPLALRFDPHRFEIRLTLSVSDARALWTAAAAKALASPGMTMVDVIDTIGPIEDPCIEDCVTMLTSPAAMPGCEVESFEVEPVRVIRLAA